MDVNTHDASCAGWRVLRRAKCQARVISSKRSQFPSFGRSDFILEEGSLSCSQARGEAAKSKGCRRPSNGSAGASATPNAFVLNRTRKLRAHILLYLTLIVEVHL